MNKSEAFDIMTAAYDDFDSKLTLGLPLIEKVMESAWYAYCQGFMPNGAVRAALVKTLIAAE